MGHQWYAFATLLQVYKSIWLREGVGGEIKAMLSCSQKELISFANLTWCINLPKKYLLSAYNVLSLEDIPKTNKHAKNRKQQQQKRSSPHEASPLGRIGDHSFSQPEFLPLKNKDNILYMYTPDPNRGLTSKHSFHGCLFLIFLWEKFLHAWFLFFSSSGINSWIHFVGVLLLRSHVDPWHLGFWPFELTLFSHRGKAVHGFILCP